MTNIYPKNGTQPHWQTSHNNYTPCIRVRFRKLAWKENICILLGKQLTLHKIKLMQPASKCPAELKDEFWQLWTRENHVK